jgi:hypothetical protein
MRSKGDRFEQASEVDRIKSEPGNTIVQTIEREYIFNKGEKKKVRKRTNNH